MINQLIGCTIASITGLERLSEEVFFKTDNGRVFKMYHHISCCESVSIEDIEGDVEDLLNSPIVLAEAVTDLDVAPPCGGEFVVSYTWTFYRIATTKGMVVIRWYGESNGYYSEDVDFYEMENEND